MEFREGDRVVCLDNFEGASIKGFEATVVRSRASYQIGWDEYLVMDASNLSEVKLKNIHTGWEGIRNWHKAPLNLRPVYLYGGGGFPKYSHVIQKIKQIDQRRKELGYKW